MEKKIPRRSWRFSLLSRRSSPLVSSRCKLFIERISWNRLCSDHNWWGGTRSLRKLNSCLLNVTEDDKTEKLSVLEERFTELGCSFVSKTYH